MDKSNENNQKYIGKLLKRLSPSIKDLHKVKIHMYVMPDLPYRVCK